MNCPDCGAETEEYENGSMKPWHTCHDCDLSVLPTGEVVRFEKDPNL